MYSFPHRTLCLDLEFKEEISSTKFLLPARRGLQANQASQQPLFASAVTSFHSSRERHSLIVQNFTGAMTVSAQLEDVKTPEEFDSIAAEGAAVVRPTPCHSLRCWLHSSTISTTTMLP